MAKTRTVKVKDNKNEEILMITKIITIKTVIITMTIMTIKNCNLTKL